MILSPSEATTEWRDASVLNTSPIDSISIELEMSNIATHVTEVTIPPNTETKTYEVDVPGLTDNASGWAWYRPRPTWIEAQHLPSLKDLKEFTVHMLLFRLKDGEYVCILPISSDTAFANLSNRGPGDSRLAINVRGASHTNKGRAAVVVTRTHNERYIAALPRVAVSEGRKWLLSEPIAYQPLTPGPFDGVGFCTWNALEEGNNVNEDSVRHLLDTLAAARLPIQTFIIDDGWHDMRHFKDASEPGEGRRGLWTFNAKPEMGKRGLKGIVDMIKDKLEPVESTGKTDVGAWIALTGGYWDGVHPESPLVEKYGCKKYPASRRWWKGCPNDPHQPNYHPTGESFYVLPPPERAEEFWSDFFTSLRDAGITFLKVDNQAAVTSLDGVDGVHEALTIWETMYRVADRVFGPGRVIHCMAHSEAIWAGPQGLGLTTRGERFVWRNSDDFGLTGRSPYAHQQHFFTNLMNTIVTNTLCTVPDADMFMTAKQHQHAHALLRALFPGPLLLTDKPGEHDSSLLWRLIARNKRGIATVLKPARAPEPLARRLMDTSILDYEDGTGQWAAVNVGPVTIIGVWNTRGGYDKPCRVDDKITVKDVEDALGHDLDENYFVTRMGVQNPSVISATVVTQGDKGTLGHINDIPMLGAASFWVARVLRLPVGRLAVLGLVDHFAGPAAVHSVKISTNAIQVQLSCAGKLGILVAAPHKPSPTALVDGRPESVDVTLLPSLAGERQGVFLLTVDVQHTCEDGDVSANGWQVHIAIA